MTKTDLQLALAEATQTNKRLDVFLRYAQRSRLQNNQKNGEFVLPGFDKLVKQKRKARRGFNPKTQQKIKIPAKTVIKSPRQQGPLPRKRHGSHPAPAGRNLL
jgi:nucleoid DNA-binding protein